MNTLQITEKRNQGDSGIGPLHVVAALIISLLLGIMVSSTSYAQEGASGGVRVTIDAPAQVGVGEVITLRLRVEGDVQVGGFEGVILYDRAAGEFAGYAPPVPGELGLGQLSVPEMTIGSAVGFYTCGTTPCMSQRELQVQAAVSPGLLGEVEVLPLVAGSIEFKLGHVLVVDRTGQTIAVTVDAPSVTVLVGEGGEAHPAPTDGWTAGSGAETAAVASITAADITQDGEVGHSDVMEVAMAWQIVREAGEPCDGREASADLNGDGCVNIVDVQSAAGYANGDNVPPASDPVPSDPVQWPEQMYLPQIGNPNEAMAQVAAVMTFTVNSTLDEYDAKLSDNKCLTASGVCTLRAAIAQATAHPGFDVVQFNIPGSGVQTIQIGSRLPSLWDSTGGTLVDGYSQPGAVPNSDPFVSNAQIMVQIRGNGSEAFDGISISTAGNIVRGLALFNLRRSIWIYGAGAQENQILGNFVGTDAAGTFAMNVTSSQQANGVHIEQGASHNEIGGVLPADRNVVSGNARQGIGLWHLGTDYNMIRNNIIGLEPNGTRRLSNRVHGMDVNFSASHNIVGGLLSGERNLISGNNGTGAEVSHGAETTDNLFIGNYIGTDPSGNASGSFSANGRYGISLKDRIEYNVVSDNVVGNSLQGGIYIDNFGNCCTRNNIVRNNRIGIGVNGGAIGNTLFGIMVTAPQNQIGPGNIIANNPVGVVVDGNDSDRNKITQNSIFGNVGLGIDLTPQSQVNANDVNDADTGPNEQLNYPVIEVASPSQVTGTACANCTVEIFLADSGAGAYGEGRTFVGTGVAAADGKFMVTIVGATSGDFVTATAIDAAGNTSEFALNQVIGTPQPWETVFAVPGRIESENYRIGGSGVGYSDTTAGNSGRQYRNDDVDIETSLDTGGGYDVAWIMPGEWLAYDINVATDATYQVVARLSTPSGNRKFHLEIDGTNVSGSVTMPWTNGWQNWTNVTFSIPLTAGPHTLRFVAETDRFNVNYLEFSIP